MTTKNNTKNGHVSFNAQLLSEEVGKAIQDMPTREVLEEMGVSSATLARVFDEEGLRVSTLCKVFSFLAKRKKVVFGRYFG